MFWNLNEIKALIYLMLLVEIVGEQRQYSRTSRLPKPSGLSGLTNSIPTTHASSPFDKGGVAMVEA